MKVPLVGVGTVGAAIAQPSADASNQRAVEKLARAHDVDLVMNAVDPRYVMPVFQGALAADGDYMDLAVSTPALHPTDPYGTVGRIIGDEQSTMDDLWRERGRLAMVGKCKSGCTSGCTVLGVGDWLQRAMVRT